VFFEVEKDTKQTRGGWVMRTIVGAVVICANDGGACAALVPVANSLMVAGYTVTWVTQTGSIAEERLKGFRARVIQDTDEDISLLLEELNPDIVVAGVSGNGPDLTLHLSQVAMREGIPVVKVLDFYGTGMPHEKGFAPTRMCVLDSASIDYEASMRGMPHDHVIATGAPQLDALLSVTQRDDGEKEDEKRLVLCVFPSNEERILEFAGLLEEGLEGIEQEVRLGLLLHPKSRPSSYEDSLVERLRRLPNVEVLTDANTRSLGKGGQLLQRADFVVGTTSSEIVAACCLLRPVLSILPHGGPNHEVLLSRGIEKMPTSDCGASLHAENGAEVKQIFALCYPQGRRQTAEARHVLAAMKSNQAMYYPLDGRNADRVAAVVVSVLRSTK